MGRATRLKEEALLLAELRIRGSLDANTKRVKAELSKPVPDVSEDFVDFEGFFIRSKESFSLKTKSKDRDKQRLEFVRHAFHRYYVPAFMLNAWETPPRPQPQHRYQFGIPQRLNYGFATKIDYRFWYVCIATGGSFYKEYGNQLFTKKECHLFLTCKHEIKIDEAIVYAIAFAECNNTGKALRIAKSKINAFGLTNEFWREVIRFFARQEPKSKEQLDDIIDYIVYKKREDADFTIIGKGHTLESLCNKVEEWHHDLRRLKAIGEGNWDGINVKDSEYVQKDGIWKFTQIKSAKDLQREGNAMRHCVLSYKRDCIEGRCSIWSLTFNDNRKLTIEVKGHYVAQIRGLANRMARPDEKSIISRWASSSGFRYAY